MKNKLFLTLTLLMSMALTQSVSAYDFSAVAPTGQTLYYDTTASFDLDSIHNGGCAYVTHPNTSYSSPYSGFTKPTGALIIPDSVIYNGRVYLVAGINQSAFSGCGGLTSVTLPDSLVFITSGAFSNCSSLTSISIPDNVRIIDDAFKNCSNLTSIHLPDSLQYVQGNTFFNCSRLTSITIPDRAYAIGGGAFENCTSLVSVIIGSGVTSILSYAFYGCNHLSTVTMYPVNAPTIGAYGGSSFPSSVFPSNVQRIIVPCGSFNSYYTADTWSSYRSKLSNPDVDFNISFVSTNGWEEVTQSDGCNNTAVIRAYPYTGYHFEHWENGSIENPRTLHLWSDTIITAYYAINQYTMNVQSDNDEQGSVSGGGTFDHGTITTIAAIPNNGFHFTRWNDGNTDNPRLVQITSNCTYTAYFDISYYTVSVSSNDILRGSVQGGGSNYTYGMPATVEATPYSGYVLSQWSNGAYYNPYTFAVTEDVDLVAEFVAVGTMFRITTEVNNAALGHVEGGGMYGVGEYAMLTAVPNDNCWFEHWQDGSTDNPRQVYVGCDATYTAYFSSPGVGIPDAEADHSMTIHTDGRRIVVDGADGQEVRVFDIMGRMVDVDMGNGKGTARLVVPSAGVYLLKIDGRPARRIVVVK